MTRSISPLEFGSFTKGLNTDGSPLNQEPDSAREISNFDLDIDGTIKRRKGLSKQAAAYTTGVSVDSVLTTPVASYDDYKDSVSQKVQQYAWAGLGTSGDIVINVTILGGLVTFQRLGGSTVEGMLIGDDNATSFQMSQPTDRTIQLPVVQVGKKLVVGQPNISFTVFEYEDGAVSVTNTYSITVRDLWGVSMISNSGEDYSVGTNINKRPDWFTFPNNDLNYVYNLRNQGYNIGRWFPTNTDNHPFDPLFIWDNEAKSSSFPSMADSVSKYLYPDTSLTDGTKDRYHANDSFADIRTSERAVRGAFVIELGDRKTARISAFRDSAELVAEVEGWYGRNDIDGLVSDVSSLQEMPRAMGEFAGRLWFGGFSGASTGQHTESPDLSNLIFFSQLNTSEANLFKCYQAGDPTSKEAPDVVATDGGFVSILGMGGAGKLVEMGNSIVVFAKTGVWAITGTDAGGFSATGFEVKKLSSTGTEMFNSIVLTGDNITYLTGDGVYAIQKSDIGELTSGKITQGVLDKFFAARTTDQLKTAIGAYSSKDREVRWVMHDNLGAKELKFSMNLGAFSLNDYAGDLFDGGAALPVGIIALPHTTSFSETGDIVIGGDTVVVGTDQVVVTYDASREADVDFLYLVAQRGTIPTSMQYGYATLEDDTFEDFSTFSIPADSSWSAVTGTDASASLLMSHYTGGDTQRTKSVPYLSMMFQKTETGFDSDWEPIGASSCLVQAQWDWADSAASNKFGRQFQAYRHRRVFMPDSMANFDNGHEVVTSKSKLRGKGKALSLKFDTEAGLDCHILGWSMNMSIGNAV